MSNVDYRLCRRDISSNDTASAPAAPAPRAIAPWLAGYAVWLEMGTLAYTLGRLVLEAASRD